MWFFLVKGSKGSEGSKFLYSGTFLVLLVNDVEYNNSTGQKPIQCHCGIYLVSPGALLRAPTPPRPPFWGEGSTKKENRVRRRGRGVSGAISEWCNYRRLEAGEANLSFPLHPG